MMGWADKYRRLKIRANCNTPTDAENAAKFGAEGIGLCRTERMFFAEDRILNMRSMILSDTTEQREAALERLRPYQVADFYAMYMSARSTTSTSVCLIPLFTSSFRTSTRMPRSKKSRRPSVSMSRRSAIRINQLHQANPMMGFRGVRLCVAYPEIYRMQATAIIQAALKASKDLGHDVEPEIMIPLTGEEKELRYAKQVVVEAVEERNEERWPHAEVPRRHDDRNSERRLQAGQTCQRC
jgi:pyruvate,orthophosphate dikinase